jgi:ribbon-helix-helix CopG family protein
MLPSVNFNVYLDDAVARRLDLLAKRTGKPRNAIIRHAVATLLERAHSEWPTVVLEWAGDASIPPFEQARVELLDPPEDPFRPTLRPSHRGKRARKGRAPK